MLRQYPPTAETVGKERAASLAQPPNVVQMLLAERPQGTFSRQLFLGETLDTDHIEADYADGVLTIRLPVAESAKPRKVSINAESNGRTRIGASA